jgi:diadenosine tetraphosphate (Ap4A) HIT family hydrolase
MLNVHCETCEIISGHKGGFRKEENIIKLNGDWVINHYGKLSDGYVGYLVLSTKDHIKSWEELSDDNLKALGLNIKWITKNLKCYWEKQFSPKDILEQVYFAYFNDSAWIHHIKGQEPDTEVLNSLHVHFHVLPRTHKMLEICHGDMMAFDLLKLRDCFPLEYICLREDDERILNLINYLKNKATWEQL